MDPLNQRQGIVLTPESSTRGKYTTPGYYVIDRWGVAQDGPFDTQSLAFANLRGRDGVGYIDQPKTPPIVEPFPPVLQQSLGSRKDIMTTADLAAAEIETLQALASASPADSPLLLERLESIRFQREAASYDWETPTPPPIQPAQDLQHTAALSDWMVNVDLPSHVAATTMVSAANLFFEETPDNVRANWGEYVKQAHSAALLTCSVHGGDGNAYRTFMDAAERLHKIAVRREGSESLLPWSVVLPPLPAEAHGPIGSPNLNQVNPEPGSTGQPLPLPGAAVPDEYGFEGPSPEEMGAASAGTSTTGTNADLGIQVQGHESSHRFDYQRGTYEDYLKAISAGSTPIPRYLWSGMMASVNVADGSEQRRLTAALQYQAGKHRVDQMTRHLMNEHDAPRGALRKDEASLKDVHDWSHGHEQVGHSHAPGLDYWTDDDSGEPFQAVSSVRRMANPADNPGQETYSDPQGARLTSVEAPGADSWTQNLDNPGQPFTHLTDFPETGPYQINPGPITQQTAAARKSIVHKDVRLEINHRLNNSVNGNPRYNVDLHHPGGDVTNHNTASDSSCNYDVENVDRSGEPVDVETHASGNIHTIRRKKERRQAEAVQHQAVAISRNCENGNHSDCHAASRKNCNCACHNKSRGYSGACAARDHGACNMDDCTCNCHNKTASLHIANQYIHEESPGDWVITQKGTGKILSHHDSEEKANEAFSAMEMNKHGGSLKVAGLYVVAADDDENGNDFTGWASGGDGGGKALSPGAYDLRDAGRSEEGRTAPSPELVTDVGGDHDPISFLGNPPVQGYVMDEEHPHAEMFPWRTGPVGAVPSGAAAVADVPTPGVVSAEQTGSSYPQPRL